MPARTALPHMYDARTRVRLASAALGRCGSAVSGAPLCRCGCVADVRRLLAEAVDVAEDFAQQEGMIAGELTALRELLAKRHD